MDGHSNEWKDGGKGWWTEEQKVGERGGRRMDRQRDRGQDRERGRPRDRKTTAGPLCAPHTHRPCRLPPVRGSAGWCVRPGFQ